MTNFLGEYECKIDAKGRVMLPVALKKQVSPEAKERFVINRGIEKHLVLYPLNEWQKITEEINKLNLFVQKNRVFMRKFHNGATELDLDATGRILLPKSLMEYAAIDKDVVLFAYANRIEVWGKAEYERMLSNDEQDFSALAEEVMGGKKERRMIMTYHEPVMIKECIEALDIKPDGIYVDVTFGGGGHSRAILKKLRNGKLFAFDQDADAASNEIEDDRFVLLRQNFKFLKKYLRFYNALPIDGLLADLGISSYQIDVPERGFSTRFDAELDMRMDRSQKKTARDIITEYNEKELQNIFQEYGEVSNAKRLARVIVSKRKENPINSINEFKKAIEECVPKGKENSYYAQVFQALRIETNNELEALKEMLSQCAESVAKGGKLVIMSYHSLEDRLVKNYMNKGKFEGEIEKNEFGQPKEIPPFIQLTKKPIQASEIEIKNNSRARSAKLRIAIKN